MAGGNLSALIVDLAGLEFGNALLSALGVPGPGANPVLRHQHAAA